MANAYVEIPLTKGYVALIDIDEYEDISQFKWHANVQSSGIYARRSVRRGVSQESEYLHRRILNFPESLVDHSNGNSLDNRRCNLRIATSRQNNTNRNGFRSRNTSGYIGVDKQLGKWRAQIVINGRKTHLGRFEDINDAALAYDAAAIIHHGEFAVLNFGGKNGYQSIRY